LVPADSTEAVDAVRETTDQNVGAILSTLAFGVPATATEPPHGARKLMKHSIAGAGDITVLLRAYRYGHELLWKLWSEYVIEQLGASDVLSEVLVHSSQHMFTFIDQSCEHLVSTYREEFGGISSPSSPHAPIDIVQELLSEKRVDDYAASRQLQFDIRAHHVAVVLTPLHRAADLRSAIDGLRQLGNDMLTVPVGDGTWWAWCSWPERPDQRKLAEFAALELAGVLVGMGEPGTGRKGFRRSHYQAREADKVARLGGDPRAGVVRHSSVEFAAVLCASPERARRFARDRLGKLQGNDETSERLRETVLAYLSNGCNKLQTGEQLHVHYKTVTYRLAQAAAALGRPLDENIIELAAALLIEQTLHGPQSGGTKSLAGGQD
jgi:hypothetical protein